MARFRYTCLDKDATEWAGVIGAQSVDEAIRVLRDLGVYPTDVEPCANDTPIQLSGLPSMPIETPSHVLGSCPTCHGQIARSASACPHCGEVEFEILEEISELCDTCNATGHLRSQLGALGDCPDCSDGRRIQLKRVDLRSRK